MSSTSYSPSETSVIGRKSVSSSAGRTWIWSLTGVCFLFGMFLAMQLRAQQRIQNLREANAVQPQVVQAQMQNLKNQADKEKESRVAIQNKYNELQKKLASVVGGSDARAKQLTAQTRDLQLMAGLTPVVGSGLTIVMTDNPDASKAGGETAFLPGIVHDYDILQVVNELRAAGAEAIAVNGTRITGFTPIRCVGPVIYVNGEPVAAPFRLEAVGNADTMRSALEMPGGIVEKLSGLLGVKVRKTATLKLPATESVPKMRHAKVG
jgi:uncharacterized protein YlxW (UPF0749 family)